MGPSGSSVTGASLQSCFSIANFDGLAAESHFLRDRCLLDLVINFLCFSVSRSWLLTKTIIAPQKPILHSASRVNSIWDNTLWDISWLSFSGAWICSWPWVSLRGRPQPWLCFFSDRWPLTAWWRPWSSGFVNLDPFQYHSAFLNWSYPPFKNLPLIQLRTLFWIF